MLTDSRGAAILTHSRRACFRACPRRHYLAYELGLRPIESSEPLRIGGAFHLGRDFLRRTSFDEAVIAVRQNYAEIPEWVSDVNAWLCECAKVVGMLTAYEWRWRNERINWVELEYPFRELPIVNPETGRPTPNFKMGGKIDEICKLEDGRLAVAECKTTSDDIAAESDYWRLLKRDPQISGYMHAARECGYDVQTVLYDVVRKPAIRPLAMPLRDEDGSKIVVDASGERVRTKDGKKWRETADKEQGFELRTRPETPDEYCTRIVSEMTLDPDRYFARREIPRLESDLDLFRSELWQEQQAIREAQRSGRWYRNAASCLQPYRCDYHENVCDMEIGPDTPPPAGFMRVENIHPELET